MNNNYELLSLTKNRTVTELILVKFSSQRIINISFFITSLIRIIKLKFIQNPEKLNYINESSAQNLKRWFQKTQLSKYMLLIKTYATGIKTCVVDSIFDFVV